MAIYDVFAMQAMEGQFDVVQIQNFLIALGGGGALGFMTGAALKVRA